MCDKCGKRPATTIIRKNINGKYSEYALCSECAAEEQIFSDFRELVPAFFSLPEWESARETVCPFCGATAREVRRTGRAGCAECYKTFDYLFDPYISRIHGDVSHTGAIPVSANEEITRRKRIRELRTKLKEAVEKEEYENAATMRDELRSLEKLENGAKEAE